MPSSIFEESSSVTKKGTAIKPIKFPIGVASPAIDVAIFLYKINQILITSLSENHLETTKLIELI